MDNAVDIEAAWKKLAHEMRDAVAREQAENERLRAQLAEAEQATAAKIAAWLESSDSPVFDSMSGVFAADYIRLGAWKAGKSGCQCQWEAGDSPCRVHGEDEE